MWQVSHVETAKCSLDFEKHHPQTQGQSVGPEEKTRRKFPSTGTVRSCLKTFVAPFLPARLTAPGSPRMEKHSTEDWNGKESEQRSGERWNKISVFTEQKKKQQNKTKFKKKVNLRKSTYKNISLNKMTVCTVTTPFSLDMFVVPS